MEGITYIENFIKDPVGLFDLFNKEVIWDERMSSRKTASYGKVYNYSQMDYVHQEMTPVLMDIIRDIETVLNYQPNNCLLNYYHDGSSKMGFHSDRTDIVEEGTGVSIISLGTPRIFRFRNIKDTSITKDYMLPLGSFIHMTNEVQDVWQHGVPKSDTTDARISVTFRKVK